MRVRIHKRVALWSLVTLSAATLLTGAGVPEELPADQITCPHHGGVTHGGPRRLRLDPSGATKAALARGVVSLGETLQLSATFEMPRSRYLPTAISGTKLADALRALGEAGEFQLPIREGSGTMTLIPRGGEVSAVVLKTSAGDQNVDVGLAKERVPSGRGLPSSALVFPLDTSLFTSGARAEVEIQLLSATAKSGAQGVALEAELNFSLDAQHPERSIADQEHSFGRTTIFFDVANDGKLARASIFDSVDRQVARMNDDVPFLLQRRVSSATLDPGRHQPLTQANLDVLDKLGASPVVVDIKNGVLASGELGGAR